MAEHMKQHERAQIEILLKREFSIPQIARELNRPAMTITREIKKPHRFEQVMRISRATFTVSNQRLEFHATTQKRGIFAADKSRPCDSK